MDLEWNTAYSKKRKGFFNEIIEFGAVRLNDRLEVSDSFQQLVGVQISKRITGLVTGLTNLKLADLSGGNPFPRVLSQFSKWVGRGDTVIMTWSNTDLLVLMDNIRYFTGQHAGISFMKKYLDMQKLTQAYLRTSGAQQIGLKDAALKLGITGEGFDLHRARDDCLLCAEIFRKVFSRQTVYDLVQIVNDEFYERLLFKPYYISNSQSRHISPASFEFYCPDCSQKARRLEEFRVRNRTFSARFRCSQCAKDFIGNLRVKRHYDFVVEKQKISPVREETQKNSD